MGMVQLLFGFQGRINRAQYWTASLAVGFIAALLAMMLFLMTGLSLESSQEDMVRGMLAFLAALVPIYGAVCWISMALQVKRFHDRGQSGFWALLPVGMGFLIGLGMIFLLPILCIVWLAFLVNLGFLPGQESDNRFGSPPGSPGAAGPSRGPRPAQSAASSLFGAEQAMERALAEQKLRAANPTRAAAQTPRPVPVVSPGQPSFGRRGA